MRGEEDVLQVAACSFVRVVSGGRGDASIETGVRGRVRAEGGPWRIRGDERAGNGDGRRADGILRSVQYVPICRHVLSIPPGALLPTYLPTYLPTFMPHGIVTSIPSYAR